MLNDRSNSLPTYQCLIQTKLFVPISVFSNLKSKDGFIKMASCEKSYKELSNAILIEDMVTTASFILKL